MRSPSSTTNTLPSGVAACSWESASRPRSPRTVSAPATRSRARPPRRAARSPSTVEAVTEPSREATMITSIWVDRLRSSSIAAAASIELNLAHADILTADGGQYPQDGAAPAAHRGQARASRHLEVPARPRPAPGGDGRLLRAPLARAVPVPDGVAARIRRARLAQLLPDPRAGAHPARPVRARPASHRPGDPARRRHAGRHRPDWPRVGHARVLLGARVGAEHRVRRPETHVPAPEVGHLRARDRLAARALHVADRDHGGDRLVPPPRTPPGRPEAGPLRGEPGRVDGRHLPVPGRRLQVPDERRAAPRGRVAGGAGRDRALPGALLGPLALPALLRPAAHAARLRRPGAA